MSNKISPCPFCGESKELSVSGGGSSSRWHVVCGRCWVNGPASFEAQHFSIREQKKPGEAFRAHPGYANAIKFWNKRSLPHD